MGGQNTMILVLICVYIISENTMQTLFSRVFTYIKYPILYYLYTFIIFNHLIIKTICAYCLKQQTLFESY